MNLNILSLSFLPIKSTFDLNPLHDSRYGVTSYACTTKAIYLLILFYCLLN